MGLTRMPRKGEKIRLPKLPYREELIVIVDHVDENDLVWCMYPNGRLHPLIGFFKMDQTFNQYAEIIE